MSYLQMPIPICSTMAQKTYGHLPPVSQQGAGLKQAYDAAHSRTVRRVSSLAFNDIDHFQPSMTFTISNFGDDEICYDFSNGGAATAHTLPANPSGHPDPFPTSWWHHMLRSSSRKTTPLCHQLDLTPPADLDESRLAVYSGHISLNATDGESLSVQYQGVSLGVGTTDPYQSGRPYGSLVACMTSPCWTKTRRI